MNWLLLVVIVAPAWGMLVFLLWWGRRMGRRGFEAGVVRGVDQGFEAGWHAANVRLSAAIEKLHGTKLDWESLAWALEQVDTESLAGVVEETPEELEEWYAKQQRQTKK